MLTGGCWEKEWGFPWRPFSSGGGGRWRIRLNMSSSRGVRVEEPRSACSTDISSHRRWPASYLPNASVTFIWWSDPLKKSESKCLNIRYTHGNYLMNNIPLSLKTFKNDTRKTWSNMQLTAIYNLLVHVFPAVCFTCNSKELRNKMCQYLLIRLSISVFVIGGVIS